MSNINNHSHDHATHNTGYSAVAPGDDNDAIMPLKKEATTTTTTMLCVDVQVHKLTVMLLVVVTALSVGFLVGRAVILGINNNSVGTCSTTDNDSFGYHPFEPTDLGKEMQATLDAVLVHQGPKAALQQLALQMTNSAALASNCHPIAHRLGRKALLRHWFPSVQSDFQPLGTATADNLLRTCNGAFLHGIVEHYLSRQATLQDLEMAIYLVQDVLCARIAPGDAALDNTWECHHGVGHGVAQYHRQRAQRQMLHDALATCDKMDNSDNKNNKNNDENDDTHNNMATTCQNGVWMDHFANNSNNGITIMDAKETIQVCLNDYDGISLTPESQQNCVYYAPTAYLRHYPRDYIGAMEFCLVALAAHPADANTWIDDKNAVQTCIHGVGGQAAKDHLGSSQFAATVEAICLQTPPGTPDDSMLSQQCFEAALDYYATSLGVTHVPEAMCSDSSLVRFEATCRQYAGLH